MPNSKVSRTYLKYVRVWSHLEVVISSGTMTNRSWFMNDVVGRQQNRLSCWRANLNDSLSFYSRIRKFIHWEPFVWLESISLNQMFIYLFWEFSHLLRKKLSRDQILLGKSGNQMSQQLIPSVLLYNPREFSNDSIFDLITTTHDVELEFMTFQFQFGVWW